MTISSRGNSFSIKPTAVLLLSLPWLGYKLWINLLLGCPDNLLVSIYTAEWRKGAGIVSCPRRWDNVPILHLILSSLPSTENSPCTKSFKGAPHLRLDINKKLPWETSFWTPYTQWLKFIYPLWETEELPENFIMYSIRKKNSMFQQYLHYLK